MSRDDLRAGEMTMVRELASSEFPLADRVWLEYHDTTGDPGRDRIFGVFVGGELVSVGRCRRHPDGMEVDGIFTPAKYRGRGYARLVMRALVEACHNDDLYMYAVRHLAGFYAGFGFQPILERDLPKSVRDRYTWAVGDMEGAEVQPMLRKAGL